MFVQGLLGHAILMVSVVDHMQKSVTGFKRNLVMFQCMDEYVERLGPIGYLSYPQARLYRIVFEQKNTATVSDDIDYMPYLGSFQSVTFTLAFDRDSGKVLGEYSATAATLNGKPVFRKKVPKSEITHMWCSDENKWVCGLETQMTHPTASKTGYAATKDPAEWPHRTHDWVLSETSTGKICSYSCESQYLTSSSGSELFSSDEGEGPEPPTQLDTAADAAGQQRRSARQIIATERFKRDDSTVRYFSSSRCDRDKERKRTSGKGKSDPKRASRKSNSDRRAAGGAYAGPSGAASCGADGLR